MADGRGGRREGAGRPKQEDVRGKYQMRAFPDEWEIVKRFAKLIKHGDREACLKALEQLEAKTE